MKRGDRVRTPNGYEGEVESIQPDGLLVRVRLRKRPDGNRVRSPLWWAGHSFELVSLQEPSMNDFKVGDVVQLVSGNTISGAGYHLLEVDAPLVVDRIRNAPGTEAPWICIRPQGCPQSTPWIDSRMFELVSCPNEPAKPTPNAGVWGVCLGCQGDIGNSYGWCKACADNGFKDARPTQQPYPPGTKVYVTGNPEGEGFITESFTSTYLPDERIYAVMIPYAPYPIHYPASAVTVVGDAPPKSMTATEASIRAQNAKAPPEYRYTEMELDDRLDALRYAHRSLLPSEDQMRYLGDRLMRDIANTMSLPRQMLGGHAHRAPAPTDGWMPAGTYMPLKAEELGKVNDGFYSLKPLLRLPPRLDVGEQGAGISSTIPNYSRRFPSRTTQWANLGDDYELLEDA